MDKKSFKEIWGMSDGTYDKLQWLFREVLPGLLTVLGVIFSVLKLGEIGTVVLTVFGAILAWIGKSLGMASKAYMEEHDTVIKPEYLEKK